MLPGVLRHRWFAAFTSSIGIVGVGGEFERLAVPLLVLDLTHSVAAVAGVRIAQFLPYIVWGPFAGAVSDRFDRRKVMLTCDVGQSACFLLLAGLVATGAFSLWAIYALEFLAEAFGATWALVTDFSVIPSLVGESELTQANAVYLGTDHGVRAIGPALAGLAIATIGIPAALAITGVSFLATATVIFFMPAGYKLADRPAPFTLARFAGEVGEGFGYVLRHPILRALGILMFVANLGGAGLQTIVLYYLREELALDPGAIGVALSFTGLAGIGGAVIAPRLAQGRPLGTTMVGVATLAALFTAIATYTADVRAVIVGVGGRSFTQAAHIVYAYLPRQREIPPRLRGRANGAFRQMILIGNALSPAALAATVDRFGTSTAFAVASTLMLLAAVITYFSPLRAYDIKPVDTEPLAAVEEAETSAE